MHSVSKEQEMEYSLGKTKLDVLSKSLKGKNANRTPEGKMRIFYNFNISIPAIY